MTVVAQEKRLVLRVLACWREIRAGRTMPTLDEMTGGCLGADEAFSFTLSIPDQGAAPRFEWVGAAFAPDYRNLAGRPRSACPTPSVLADATSCLDEVLHRRVPVSIGGLSRDMGRPVVFRSILLPLSSNGDRIDALLGAVNFRIIEGSVGFDRL